MCNWVLDLLAIVKKFRKNTSDFPRLKIRWKKLACAVQNYIERFNLATENMAHLKCSLTVPSSSWQRFNLAIENMARFKCSSTLPRGPWQRFNLAIENMARFKYSSTVSHGSWQRLNFAIENMERFKYVQDGLAYSKIK